MFLLSAISLLCLTGAAWAQVDCTGLPDGNYGAGCRSYTQCTGGVGTIVDCPLGYAFSSLTQQCEPVDHVPPPCGTPQDCSTRPDGRYPVMPDCRYFYTCSGGVHIGTNPCNNPPDTGDLVFDEVKQLCDWIWSVPSPCGTYVPKGGAAAAVEAVASKKAVEAAAAAGSGSAQ